MAGIDASRVINGTFGSVYINGEWQTNIYTLQADIELQKASIKLCGDRWEHTKVIGLKGTGKITGYKVTSDMIALNMPVTDNTKPPAKCEIIAKLDDPEAYGVERIRLSNVIFDKISMANFEAGKEATEELSFTFEGAELLDPITA
jgi:hypothetical protein